MSMREKRGETCLRFQIKVPSLSAFLCLARNPDDRGDLIVLSHAPRDMLTSIW